MSRVFLVSLTIWVAVIMGACLRAIREAGDKASDYGYVITLGALAAALLIALAAIEDKVNNRKK